MIPFFPRVAHSLVLFAIATAEKEDAAGIEQEWTSRVPVQRARGPSIFSDLAVCLGGRLCSDRAHASSHQREQVPPQHYGGGSERRMLRSNVTKDAEETFSFHFAKSK
jgi:hypothetical protein